MDALRNGTNGTAPRLLGPDGRPIPFDEPAIPHVHTFGSLINIASRTYSYRWDEGYSYSQADALAMRRDCYLMGLLRERQYPTAQMPWHLEPEDPKDVFQQATADEMARYVKAGFVDLESFLMTLLEALWYGRYGAQLKWKDDTVGGARAFLPVDYEPVNGDKLQYGWDGTPHLMIYPPSASDYPDEWIKHGDRSTMLRLVDPSVRDRFVIHKGDVVDADYYEADKAGGRHGVGIRHWIYWNDSLKREILSWLIDYLERTGLGLTLWFYDASNPKSEAAALKAAQDQGRNTNIVWPRGTQGPNTGAGVERVETSTAGCEIIMRAMEYFDDRAERFTVGQTLSSGTEGSGLGGTGVAAMHADTKYRIIRSDCGKLAGTLTKDLIGPLMRWNRPDAKFRLRWVFDVDRPDPDKKMEAAKTLFDMGGEIKKEEIYALAGLSKPSEEDDVLGGQQPGMIPGQPPPDDGGNDDGGGGDGGSPFPPKKPIPNPANVQPSLNRREGQPDRYYDPNEKRDASGEWTAGGSGGAKQPIRAKTDRSLAGTAKRVAGKVGRKLGHVAEHLQPKNIVSSMKAAVEKAKQAPATAAWSVAHPAQAGKKAWDAAKDKYGAMESRYGRTATLCMAGAYLGSWGLWAWSPGLGAVIAPEPSAQLIGIAEGILSLRKAHKARKRLKNVQALREQPVKHAKEGGLAAEMLAMFREAGIDLPVDEKAIAEAESALAEGPEQYGKDASGHEHKGPGPGGGQFTGDGGGGQKSGDRPANDLNRQPEESPARPLSGSGKKVADFLEEHIGRAKKLEKGQAEKYQRATHAALSSMPEKAQARIAENVKDAEFFADGADLAVNGLGGRDWFSKLERFLGTGPKFVPGAYVRTSGKLYLAEGVFVERLEFSPHEGWEAGTRHCFAHEMCHALDGPKDAHSETEEWKAAWREEIGEQTKKQSPPVTLSSYAQTHPAEGFAEFGRAVYVGGKSFKDVKAKFPKCAALWEQWGYAPAEKYAREEAGEFEPLPEIFTDRFDTPDGAIDIAKTPQPPKQYAAEPDRLAKLEADVRLLSDMLDKPAEPKTPDFNDPDTAEKTIAYLLSIGHTEEEARAAVEGMKGG